VLDLQKIDQHAACNLVAILEDGSINANPCDNWIEVIIQQECNKSAAYWFGIHMALHVVIVSKSSRLFLAI